jgi:hypothetical protein
MRVKSALLLMLLVVALVGCGGSKEAQVVGKWKGDESARGAMLDFKADKTFSTDGMDGTWALTGDKIELTIVNLGGQSLASLKEKMKGTPGADAFDKPISGTLAADMKSMSLSAPGASGGKMTTFTKQGS